ncbi:MAG: hypothetical protein U0271_37525 [Polyangiaceae bacterium]
MVALLFLGSAAIGGCDACRKVTAHTKNPPPETVESAVREKLEKAPEQSTKLCGVPVSGLRDLKLKIEKSVVPGFSQITVEGSPILETTASSATPAPSGSAKPRELVPPAVCVGVLTAMMVAKTDAKGEIQSWSLEQLTVDEVKTPGAEWKRPHEHHDWD